jgi:hypothetical protein
MGNRLARQVPETFWRHLSTPTPFLLQRALVLYVAGSGSAQILRNNVAEEPPVEMPSAKSNQW